MKTVIVKAYSQENAKSTLKTTYACSSEPMYFVEFGDGYSGYFHTKDVIDCSNMDALEIHNLKRSLNGKLIGE